MEKYAERINVIHKNIQNANQDALYIIEKEARRILNEHDNLTEFVMTMGCAIFIDIDKNTHANYYNEQEFDYIKPLWDFIEQFDNILHLTGNPMRFTATGPKITDW